MTSELAPEAESVNTFPVLATDEDDALLGAAAGVLACFVLAWIGCMSLQKGPLWWAAHHRNHHRFSDTERDVHSPKRGFWWSHMGWILSCKYEETDTARVLAKIVKPLSAEELRERSRLAIPVVASLVPRPPLALANVEPPSH